MKSPIFLLRAFLADARRLEPGVKGIDRDLHTIEKRFENEGLSFLTRTLPSIDKALLDGLRSGVFATPTGLKTTRGTKIPRFLGGFFSEIFVPSSGLLREDANVGALKLLRELCNLFKKLQLDPERSDELAVLEKEKFFRNEEFCDPDIPDHIASSIGVAACFALSSLHSDELFALSCKHGPGAVFEQVKGNQKWSLLFDRISNDDVDLTTPGLEEFFNARYGLVDHNQLELFPRSELIPNEVGVSRSCARLVAVPKNSTSVRTITVEPLYKQYVQQGLNTSLRRHIELCGILRNCIALSDQSKNQHLAKIGSITGEWSTLDMKSASDLLSLKLVRICFGSKPWLLQLLEGARSSGISDDTSVVLKKFAGMGNATTFPVQSICFALVGIAAILRARNLPFTRRNLVDASRLIRVYGDDIAVRSEYARHVVAWLESVGLKINEDKSFLEGNFRESCGLDAYKGHDVTPIYVRDYPDLTTVRPDAVAGLVALSNNLFARCLYTTAEAVKDLVENALGKRLPLVTSRSPGLGWTTRQEAFTPTKWCKDKQQLIVKTVALTPTKIRDRLDGWPALLKYFHQPAKPDGWDPTWSVLTSKDHLEKTEVRYRNRIISRWVAQ